MALEINGVLVKGDVVVVVSCVFWKRGVLGDRIFGFVKSKSPWKGSLFSLEALVS